VYGNALVSGNAWVSGNAEVYGDAWVYGNAWVSGNARVSGNEDIVWISKIGSRLGTTTAFKTKTGNIAVSCGCFYGTLEKFAEQVERTHHGDNKYGKEYKLLIELIKVHFEIAEAGREASAI